MDRSSLKKIPCWGGTFLPSHSWWEVQWCMKYQYVKLCHVPWHEPSISPKGRGCFSADLHQVEVLPVEYSSLSLRKTNKVFRFAIKQMFMSNFLVYTWQPRLSFLAKWTSTIFLNCRIVLLRGYKSVWLMVEPMCCDMVWNWWSGWCTVRFVP